MYRSLEAAYFRDAGRAVVRAVCVLIDVDMGLLRLILDIHAVICKLDLILHSVYVGCSVELSQGCSYAEVTESR